MSLSLSGKSAENCGAVVAALGTPYVFAQGNPAIELELPGVEDLSVVLLGCGSCAVSESPKDESLLNAARGLTVMEARLAFGKAAAELVLGS